MLRPSALNRLLSQVTSGSIHASILATRSGEILDYALRPGVYDERNSERSNNSSRTEASSEYEVDSATGGLFNEKNVCAILCSMFQSFQKFSTPLNDSLNFMILDCDIYRLAIRPVGNNLVCLCADSNTGLGILKLKLNSLSDSLSNMLNFSVYVGN